MAFHNHRTNHKNTHRPIFLLSIDGGGILGLLALQVLSQLEDTMGQPISALFDCITGVSAGGIIALGLGAPRSHNATPPYSAKELHDALLRKACMIFKKTAAQEVLDTLPLAGWVNALFCSKYSNHGAQEVYTQLFGHYRMSQARVHTIIPAYNIRGVGARGPHIKIFDSLSIAEKQAKNKAHPDFFMREIALATSAAPTYFPPQTIQAIDGNGRKTRSHYCLIDGGVAINNPSVLAYSYLRLRHPYAPIHTLSLGVGTHPKSYARILTNRSPGTLAWLRSFEHLVVSPQLSVYKKLFTHLQKKAPHPGPYWRIQPPYTHKPFSSLDDISPQNLQRITQMGAAMIRYHKNTLDSVAFYLAKKNQS